MFHQRLTALAIVSLFVLILIPVATAQGTPSVEEYKLPNGTAVDAMCVDSRGNVWLARSSPATLYRVDPAAGTYDAYKMSLEGDTLFRGMSAEGSSYIWIADEGGQRIVGYDVGKDKFYNFTFPLDLNPTDVIAQDNYLWVACNMELGRVNMDTNEMKDYYVDRYDASLADIAMDRMGNVWFVEYSAGKVGGYSRMDDRVHIFPIPTADSKPTCLGIDSQGRLWFLESASNKLGMFDTSLNTFKEIDLPKLDESQVYAKRLAVDSDDNVWLTDTANGRVIKYYTAEGVFVSISLNGTKNYPTLIEADGNTIWAVESGTSSLAKIRADPLYGLDATPTPTATPSPTPSATPTPKPTPGFEIVAAMGAMYAVASKLKHN
jgi:streptogramin lyase